MEKVLCICIDCGAEWYELEHRACNLAPRYYPHALHPVHLKAVPLPDSAVVQSVALVMQILKETE